MFFRNILDMIHTDLRWPLIIIFSIIIFVNASGKLQIDALLDTTPEENINKFVNSVENINPKYTIDGEATGVYMYDQNRLTYNMMYEMGHKEYYVYIFTKNISTDSGMNNSIENLLKVESEPKVYSIASIDLLGTPDEIYMDMAPVLLRLERDNSTKGAKPVTMVQNFYKDPVSVDKLVSSLGGVSSSSDGSLSNSSDSDKKADTDNSGGFFDSLFGNKDKESSETVEPENTPVETKPENEPSSESGGFFSGIKDKLFKDGELR